MDAGGVVLSLLGAAVGLVITYYLIKAAVKNGMREHQEWLDERAAAPTNAHKEE